MQTLKIKNYPMSRFLFKSRFWHSNAFILREFKYFRSIAVLAIVFTLTAAVFEGLTVGLIASFLQGLTNPNEPPIQSGIEWLDVTFLATTASPKGRIYRLSSLILLAIWLRSLLTYLGLFYSWLTQAHLCDRIRLLLFEQLQSLSLGFYSKSQSGELINTVTTEVNQLQRAFDIFTNMITRGSTLLVYIISMFWLSWQLSIAALMMYGLLSVGLSWLIARVREASFAIPKSNGKLTSVTMEYINGIKTIHAAATQDYERTQFEKSSAGIKDAHAKVAAISTLVKPIAEGVASTILIVMVIVAFNLFIVDGELRAASLLTFMFILFRMMPLVSQVNGARENLSRFHGSVDNIKELLRTDNKTYLKNGKLQFTGLKHSIELIAVDFGYDTKDLVLHDINLSIEKGKTTALVGASGAGKTTLADLIPRFYDPNSGIIAIDDINIKDLEINSLRQRMAVVSQDTFIFNNSVRYNLTYGLQDIPEELIIEVAQQANSWQFIQELPEGLDTILGDRGVRLSGGQRQRIAIARALLRDPEILILDEATSALDSLTEKLIQESLAKLSVGRTVIAIAHRLSTIIRADKIVVLEAGRIVEQGAYQELLAKQGRLWNYHQMQYGLSEVGTK